MTRTYWKAALSAWLLTVAASAALYPQLPKKLPIHWNIHGQADGFAGKDLAVLLAPSIMASLLLFYAVFAWISPKRFTDEEFREANLFIMLALVGLFAYIQACTLYAGLSGGGDVGRALIAGMFLFFAAIGNVLGKIRRNFYVGIRTPWTLANERVWTDTHRVGAWCFVVGGMGGFLWTAFGGSIAVAFVFFTTVALAPVLYSFVHYKRLERAGRLEP